MNEDNDNIVLDETIDLNEMEDISLGTLSVEENYNENAERKNVEGKNVENQMSTKRMSNEKKSKEKNVDHIICRNL
jgi:hypothetical protein